MDRVWKTKIWIDQLKLESVSLDFATGGETGVSGAPVASLVWLETRTDFYKVLIYINKRVSKCYVTDKSDMTI